MPLKHDTKFLILHTDSQLPTSSLIINKKQIIKSKDGKRVVGMYPENLREVTFKHNDKYESFYNNDDYHGDLLLSSLSF